MFGRKLYKTKLCILFQRGRCPRPSCNFAHGEAELRRFGGSFNGRRDHRSGDLRDKLDRRHSPHRRFSPGRDARAHHHTFRHQKPISHDGGSSLSRSPIRRSERRHRKKQHSDGESGASESHKASDGSEDRKKDEKISSYDDKDGLEEQLKQLQLDLEMLDDHKSQLEIFLDEKVDEAHKLSGRIEDLESQLTKEQEECRRITSKIKKIIRANGRYIKAQEELKRSQSRLQRISDQLSSETLKINANDDPSINIISDGDPNDNGKTSPRNNDYPSNLLSIKKRPFEYPAIGSEAKNGNSRKRDRDSDVIFRSDKLPRSDGPASQSETISKGIETMKAIMNRKKSLVEEYKHKQGRSGSSSVVSLEKGKGSEMRHSLPLTGMAAQAADEYPDAIELDEKPEGTENTRDHGNDDADYGTKSAFMLPPPPVTRNAYKQYEGDDEEVDVEKVDSEMLDIDINSEVDIEQI